MTSSNLKSVKKEDIIDALKTVDDPELGLDIFTLGLVYGIEIEARHRVVITMTYTTPFCPYGPQLRDQVYAALAPFGFEEVKIEVVFEPAWKPSEEVEELLRG